MSLWFWLSVVGYLIVFPKFYNYYYRTYASIITIESEVVTGKISTEKFTIL